MLDSYKQLISHQYEAALCMLSKCVGQCPEANWNAPVANLTFSHAVFHTLFCTDLYLGPDEASLPDQEFHREHASVFGDYDESESRSRNAVYDRALIDAYLQHCRDKAQQVVPAETQETLDGPSGFDWLKFSRAELHVYNIRHIHHHAAQLSLRLRLDTGEGIPWVGSGWRD